MQDNTKRVILQLPKNTSFYQEKTEEMLSLKALSKTMGYSVDRLNRDFYLTKTEHSTIVFPQNSIFIEISVHGSNPTTKLRETLDAVIKLAVVLELGLPRINPSDIIDSDIRDFYAQKLEESFPEESKEYVREIRAYQKEIAEIEDGFTAIDDKGKEEQADSPEMEDVHAAAPAAQPAPSKFKLPHERFKEWVAEKKAASHNTKVAKLMTSFVPLKGNNTVEPDPEEDLVEVDDIMDGKEHSDTITVHLSSTKDGSPPKSSGFSRLLMSNSK
jgi:hypothetical protein